MLKTDDIALDLLQASRRRTADKPVDCNYNFGMIVSFRSFSISIFLFAASLAFGQQLSPLSAFLEPRTLGELESAGKILKSASGEAASFTSLPLTHPAMEAIRIEIEKSKPGILAEALFLMPRTAPANPPAEFAAIFATLTMLADLQGIKYWSATRNEWRTLYDESWRIDGPVTRVRVADLPPPAGAVDLSLFAFQRDLSFGSNVYRYDYRSMGSASGPGLLLTQTNLTKMSYSLIPVVAVEGLKTRILVIPAREGILFYAVSAADTGTGRVQFELLN